MTTLQPGELVEITRPSVGIPVGTIALIVERQEAAEYDTLNLPAFYIYTVWPTGEVGKRGARRYLGRDLKRLTKT